MFYLITLHFREIILFYFLLVYIQWLIINFVIILQLIKFSMIN